MSKVPALKPLWKPVSVSKIFTKLSLAAAPVTAKFEQQNAMTTGEFRGLFNSTKTPEYRVMSQILTEASALDGNRKNAITKDEFETVLTSVRQTIAAYAGEDAILQRDEAVDSMDPLTWQAIELATIKPSSVTLNHFRVALANYLTTATLPKGWTEEATLSVLVTSDRRGLQVDYDLGPAKMGMATDKEDAAMQKFIAKAMETESSLRPYRGIPVTLSDISLVDESPWT